MYETRTLNIQTDFTNQTQLKNRRHLVHNNHVRSKILNRSQVWEHSQVRGYEVIKVGVSSERPPAACYRPPLPRGRDARAEGDFTWSSRVESGSNKPETQQNPAFMHVNGAVVMSTETLLQHLECGEHDAVLAMLDTGVHQVFNQTDLRPQVPDSEDQMKHFQQNF